MVQMLLELRKDNSNFNIVSSRSTFMKSKEQCEEQMKLFLHTLAEQEPMSKAHSITQGWIHCLAWVLEHES